MVGFNPSKIKKIQKKAEMKIDKARMDAKRRIRKTQKSFLKKKKEARMVLIRQTKLAKA